MPEEANLDSLTITSSNLRGDADGASHSQTGSLLNEHLQQTLANLASNNENDLPTFTLNGHLANVTPTNSNLPMHEHSRDFLRALKDLNNQGGHASNNGNHSHGQGNGHSHPSLVAQNRESEKRALSQVTGLNNFGAPASNKSKTSDESVADAATISSTLFSEVLKALSMPKAAAQNSQPNSLPLSPSQNLEVCEASPVGVNNTSRGKLVNGNGHKAEPSGFEAAGIKEEAVSQSVSLTPTTLPAPAAVPAANNSFGKNLVSVSASVSGSVLPGLSNGQGAGSSAGRVAELEAQLALREQEIQKLRAKLHVQIEHSRNNGVPKLDKEVFKSRVEVFVDREEEFNCF